MSKVVMFNKTLDMKTDESPPSELSGWQVLEDKIERKEGDEVGRYNVYGIWICERACDTPTEHLIKIYGFTHFRRMNPPLLGESMLNRIKMG